MDQKVFKKWLLRLMIFAVIGALVITPLLGVML